MSLRPLSMGCAGILLLLGCWAAFGAVRSLRQRRWGGILFALAALCLFGLAVAPVSYLAGIGAPHAVHNKLAPVPDSALTYFLWSEPNVVGNPPAQLFALRARTGAIAWQTSLSSCAACVEVDGDTVYGMSGGGTYNSTKVFALDAATGATRWQRPVDGVLTGRAVTLVGDTLLLGVASYGPLSAPTPAPTGDASSTTTTGGQPGTDGIVALSSSDGRELWRTPLGPMTSPPMQILGGANVFYDLPDSSSVEARSLSDGHLLWTTRIANSIFLAGSDPVFDLSDDGAVTALGAANGSTRWGFGGHQTFFSPALSGGTLFVAAQRSDSPYYASDNPPIVYALDTGTGAIRWQFTTQASALVNLYASGDTVYVVGSGGLYALRTADGTVRWRAGSGDGWALTPLVGSTLYVARTVTPPPDALISIVFPKEQVYISAVDTRDGSLCWSVPIGPVFRHALHV